MDETDLDEIIRRRLTHEEPPSPELLARFEAAVLEAANELHPIGAAARTVIGSILFTIGGVAMGSALTPLSILALALTAGIFTLLMQPARTRSGNRQLNETRTSA